jgi:hypothetical protein
MTGLAQPIITAQDMLAKLRQGVEETYEVRMRGANIPVRVLSGTEINTARQAAKKATLLGKGDETDMNFEVQKNILMLASQVPAGDAPTLSRKVLDALTIDEVNFLYSEYIAVMDRVNPSLEQLDPEEFRSLVEALKKSLLTSKDLSLRQLRAICGAFQELIQRPDKQESQPGN